MPLKNWKGTPKERFLAKIKKTNTCWFWVGAKNPQGYGDFWVDNKYWRSHRYSYFIYKGTIPKDMCVLHECDNPSCVNPDHLWLGSYQDNALDMVKKGRHVDSNGGNNGRAKLKKEDVLWIRSAYSNNVSVPKIAKIFNVWETTIYDIVNNKTWIIC